MARTEDAPTISRTDRREDVLCALADPTCRAVLGAISDRAMTATEVAEATDVPLSTVYRKLDWLVDTPLVAATHRLKRGGRPPREHRVDFDQIRVRMTDRTDGTLDVSVS